MPRERKPNFSKEELRAQVADSFVRNGIGGLSPEQIIDGVIQRRISSRFVNSDNAIVSILEDQVKKGGIGLAMQIARKWDLVNDTNISDRVRAANFNLHRSPEQT